jgi:hypothetical protein
MHNFQMLPSLKNWSAESIAKLCCLAMGLHFGAENTQVEEDENEVIPRAVVPLPDDVEADEILGLRTLEHRDTEQEQWVYCDECHGKGCSTCKFEGGWNDDRSDVNAHFTTSGDSPVLKPVADTIDEMRSAGGTSDIVQTYFPKFYSAAKQQIRPSARTSDIVLFILKCDEIVDLSARQARLRKGWKVMWERHFAYAECAEHYLTPRDMKRVVNEFSKRGICSQYTRKVS